MADPPPTRVLDRIKQLGQATTIRTTGTDHHVPPHPQGARSQEAATRHHRHRRDARRRLHGRHPRAHRHHQRHVRRPVRRRLRRHRRLRPRHFRDRHRISARSDPGSTSAIVDTIASVDGVAAAEGHVSGYAQLVDSDGEPVGDPGTGCTDVRRELDDGRRAQPVPTSPRVTRQRPTDEIVIDRQLGRQPASFDVGDIATVLTKSGPGQFTDHRHRHVRRRRLDGRRVRRAVRRDRRASLVAEPGRSTPSPSSPTTVSPQERAQPLGIGQGAAGRHRGTHRRRRSPPRHRAT